MKKEKLIIIGGGLCGLYSAYLLQSHYDIIILEARERLGGRILTLEGHDMGPSWIWSHQKNILSLFKELKLEIFPQYTQGLAMYDEKDQAQRFTPPTQEPSFRLVGGLQKLTDALCKGLQGVTIHKNCIVTALNYEKSITLTSNIGEFKADKVISTLPPRLSSQLIFKPKLEEKVFQKLKEIPTWMGHACKCVVEYKTAFWKDEGLSGFAFSHQGPMGEVHDACTKDKAALFGFVQANKELTKETIIKQLVRLFGDKARNYHKFYLIDWKQEQYTSSLADAKGLSVHPNYGFECSHFEEKYIFLGTESAFTGGGYLEGAVNAALDISQRLGCISNMHRCF